MAACGKMPLLESCLLGYVKLWSQKLQSKKKKKKTSIEREGGRKIGRERLKQDANNNIQVFFEFLFQIFYGFQFFFSKFISLSRLIRYYWFSAFHLTQEASPTPPQPDPKQPSHGTKRLHPTHPYTLVICKQSIYGVSLQTAGSQTRVSQLFRTPPHSTWHRTQHVPLLIGAGVRGWDSWQSGTVLGRKAMWWKNNHN